MMISYCSDNYVKQFGCNVCAQRGTVILGMSPGNSYFKKEVIHELIHFSAQRFSTVRIFIPDIPAAHTYRALGYSEKESQKKARERGNNLRNHCRQAMIQYSHISIIDWKGEIEATSSYVQALQYVYSLYSMHKKFKEDVHVETMQVLVGYCYRRCEMSEQAIAEGAQYLLKELAFFMTCQNQNASLGYHRLWPVFEKFFSGYYDAIRKDIGFLHIVGVRL